MATRVFASDACGQADFGANSSPEDRKGFVMLALLARIRDFLVALALAWVGVNLEPKAPESPCAETTCSAETADFGGTSHP
jgi:hypothetical protein